MSLEEIEFELEMAGLNRQQINKLISSVKQSGFDPKVLDQKLRLMGFMPLFEMYYDEE